VILQSLMPCCRHPGLATLVGIPIHPPLPWDFSLVPILFAAHPGQAEKTEAQLQIASSLHPAMVILILYYLDTRKRVDDPLPSWLFLFGLLYTRFGVEIIAHVPAYQRKHQNQVKSHNGDNPGWRSHSWLLDKQYTSFFDTNPSSRQYPIAALLKIRAHTHFVLERLREWSGYKHTLQQLKGLKFY
jgi:hypothetical protein